MIVWYNWKLIIWTENWSWNICFTFLYCIESTINTITNKKLHFHHICDENLTFRTSITLTCRWIWTRPQPDFIRGQTKTIKFVCITNLFRSNLPNVAIIITQRVITIPDEIVEGLLVRANTLVQQNIPARSVIRPRVPAHHDFNRDISWLVVWT